jgi:hypothetical protein
MEDTMSPTPDVSLRTDELSATGLSTDRADSDSLSSNHSLPLDRLSPLAAVAAWLASHPAPDVAAALAAVIRGDSRIELRPDEIVGVIDDARAEGLDPEHAFERLILQGEWLSLNRMARIRPR